MKFHSIDFQTQNFEVIDNNIYFIEDDAKSQMEKQSQLVLDQDLNKNFGTDNQSQHSGRKPKSPKQQPGLSKIFSSLVIKQNIQKFIEKLTIQKKLFQKLKYRHHKILNDKSFDINQFDPDEVDEKEIYFQQLFGTLIMKKIKRQFYNLKRKFFKSRFIYFANNVIDQLLHKIPIISPEDNYKWIWDILLGIIRIYFLITIPIQLAFNNQILSKSTFEFTLFSSILLILDILFRLNTAFFQMGIKIYSRWEIFKEYQSHGMIWDILSVFALFVIFVPINLKQIINFNQHTPDEFQEENRQKRNFFDAFLLLFFTHLRHLNILKKQVEKSMSYSIVKISIYNIIKLLFTLLLVEHFFSCIWVSIGLFEYESNQKSWIETRQLEHEIWIVQYVEAIYFTTVTFITVGYGDITPQSPLEKIFCIIFMIFSSIQLSYSVNLVGNTLENLTQESDQNLRKMRILNDYLKRKGISPKLRDQIQEYLTYFWAGQQHIQQEEQLIIGQLSESLQAKLDFECNFALLESNHHFKETFSFELIKELSKYIQSITVQPDNLVEMNDKNEPSNTYFYYIEQGQILVVVIINTYKRNLYKLRLIIHLLPIRKQSPIIHSDQGSFQLDNVGFTKLLRLNRKTFLQILDKFPKDFEKYHMLKDKLIIDENKFCSSKCMYCKQKIHSIISCPAFHFLPDRERLIKQNSYPAVQERDTQKSRSSHRYKVCHALNDTLMINQTVQECRRNIQNPYDSDSDEEKGKEIEKKWKPIEQNLQQNKKKLPSMFMFIKNSENLTYKEKNPQKDNDNQKITILLEKKIQKYQQKFDHKELEKLQLLYLKMKNLNEEQKIEEFDLIRSYNYYYPAYNYKKILRKIEKNRIKREIYQSVQIEDQFLKYMIYPYEFKLRYQKQVLKKYPRQFTFNNKAFKKAKFKQQKNSTLQLFVSQARNTQIVPSSCKRSQKKKNKMLLIT